MKKMKLKKQMFGKFPFSCVGAHSATIQRFTAEEKGFCQETLTKSITRLVKKS
jgi:hypothetical protein